MSAGHQHHHGAGEGHEGRLWVTLALTAGFMLAEIVGGLLTKS
jgi:Co/Zn/Cd efflux system component